jgi:orotidine-5'-phosphate decarboxylase
MRRLQSGTFAQVERWDMPEAFNARLQAVQRRTASALCVGLDVDPSRLPIGLSQDRYGFERFVRGIVDATSDLVCAYKPNLAFYESMGADGYPLLQASLAAIPDGLITIADAKRGDIGTTAERYAAAIFDGLGFDAMTVNPYQGSDSVEPYISDPVHGAFVLCKTSNPGSADFQDLRCGEDGASLWEIVARQIVEWNERGNVGLVVGATFPTQLASARELAPDLPILIPGVGVQGGDAVESMRLGAAPDGTLAVVNVSRQVLYASSGSDWQDAARREATALRDAMASAVAERASSAEPGPDRSSLTGSR